MADQSLSHGEIFVVDDDPAVRETLSMVLSAGGYQVICFADGAALLAVARTRTPSGILLDVHIPGKSGLDILKELHGEDYPAPIFMISGQGDIAMAVNAIKNGALDFGWMRRSGHLRAGRRRTPHRKWHRCIFPGANH
jgi:FixJ family two-component response regulator